MNDEPFRNEKIFYNLSFSKVQIWVLGVKKSFFYFLLPLGSGSVNPHIFADPDPGSKNLEDLTFTLSFLFFLDIKLKILY